MELLSPAGSADKLAYAYRYGADAAYIGLPFFSLRARADNIDDTEHDAPDRLAAIKSGKKLYCALNIYFHNADLGALDAQLERIAAYPFDAFIVSDIGVLPILRRRFPAVELHLSTQANCTNREAARMYHDMGFSRIVPGRELSLDEIKAIKDFVPELEIEAFVHGAMCIAYSGRCFISAWANGRSGNRGDCSHSCRWNYRLALEEEKRLGEYFPVETGKTPSGAFTSIMSSRDLCMIDHLADLKAAGVDSLKVEGRVKSLYYVAMVTRAYRYAIDHPEQPNPYRDGLFEVSRREFSTGFFFGRGDIDTPTEKVYTQTHLLIGSLEETPPGLTVPEQSPDADEWHAPVYVELKNALDVTEALEVVSPDFVFNRLDPGTYRFETPEGEVNERPVHLNPWFIRVRRDATGGHAPAPGWILRLRRE
ncbi:MAG: U32 family peptidase [Spirochaetaceae bacterium]|nr:MAG: U32 family peptidase [Spirochaetaceae bacterium]